MPVYEYECEKCSCHFDVRQGFNDPPTATCPKCKGKAHRVLYPTPIIFKGNGFYVTDYPSTSGGNGGNGKREKTEKAEKPAVSKKEDKK